MDDLLDLNVFTRYIVVDVEATCWAEDAPAQSEVIEIGAVAVEVGTGPLDEFQTFVRPRLQPTLSDFCTQLTTIRQADVDSAPAFPEAYGNFRLWADAFSPFILTSWGNYDHKQLKRDCDLHSIPYTIHSHVNLKAAFAAIMGCKKCGMSKALRKLGIPLQGTHHRGVDDARNIARILEYLLEATRGSEEGHD